MSLREDALKLHRDNRGKLEVTGKIEVKDQSGLSLAYTPVAEPCKEIAKIRKKSTNILSRAIWSP